MSEIKIAGDTEKDGSAYTVPELEGVVPAEDGSQYASNEAVSEDDQNVHAPRPNEGIAERAFTGNVYERKFYFEDRPDDWPDGAPWPPEYPPGDAWPPGWIPPTGGGGGGGPSLCVPDPYYSCGPTNDPYWANVVLMLHMDSDFSDSSTYAHLPTVTGNAAISTAAPQFGAGCGVFDGSGDRASYTDAALALGLGDFTIECWVKVGTLSASQKGILGNSSTSPGWWLAKGTDNKLFFRQQSGGSATVANEATIAGTWYHVAVVRSSNNISLFINGTVQTFNGPFTDATAYTTPTTLYVGSYSTTAGDSFDGQIDDLRITKGVARYTGNFNIPTAAFPDALKTIPLPDNPELANTVLWLPFEDFDQNRSGALRDFSSYNHTMIASTNSAQNLVLWNGSGDKGGILYNATRNSYPIAFAPAATLDIGANDFYIEAWVYYTTAGVGSTTFGDVWTSIHAGTIYGLQVTRQMDTPPRGLRWYVSGSTLVGSPGSIPLEQWTHLACSREGTTLRLFIDGALVGSGTVSTSYTTNNHVRCLSTPGGTNPILYGDNFRMVIGDAVHTAAFTPPAMVPITQGRTVLSLHAEDTSDASCYQPKTVTLAGIAEVSAVEKKFNTASFLVTNAGTSTTNGVVVTDHQDFDFGANDFTIEMWAYRSANTYAGTLFYFTEAGVFSLVVAATTGLVTLNYRSSGGAQVGIATGVTFPLTTWQHVVIQRRGTNFEFYLHGVLGNTTAITGGASSTVNSAGAFYLGRTNLASTATWDGYIDEVRITKGVSRYLLGFDPATLPNCDSTEGEGGGDPYVPPVPPEPEPEPVVEYITPRAFSLSASATTIIFRERATFKMNGQMVFSGVFGSGDITSYWFTSSEGALATDKLEYRVLTGSIYDGEVGPTDWAPFTGDFMLTAPVPGTPFGVYPIATWEVRSVDEPSAVYGFGVNGQSLG